MGDRQPMKYRDEQTEDMVRSIRQGNNTEELVAIIEQLRSELAKEIKYSGKWSDMAYGAAQAHDALLADIWRKRARIAALRGPDDSMDQDIQVSNEMIDQVLAILDDKETPHA